MTEWIPVEERRPEKEGEYLLRFKDEKSPPEFGYYFPDTDTWHTRFFSTTMQLFNKQLILAWAPLPEMPKKKRWRPKEDEKYFFISSDYDKIEGRLWVNKGVYWNDECKRSFLGVYKTKEYAEFMRDKIKKFVESEIGEC